jgi:anti-sigma factor RsiW
MTLRPVCLWNRPRLERYADGALNPRVTRAVKAHLGGCRDCRQRAARLRQLAALVRSAVPEPAEPDWTGFWAGIQARMVRDAPRPMRDPWWLPFWKPFWGHPRLAMGGVMVAVLAALFSLWPVPDRPGQVPAAWAGPVLVQDVGTPDPERTVMVYSTPDEALTVIWLFPADAASDES